MGDKKETIVPPATFGPGVNSISFDPITGVLSVIGGVFMIGFANWLTFHPYKK